ncbi:MAG TPA: hypothetical protein VM577_18490, partial [Anaerovoracaceae bacterium]|nr:hypothetical protein [Anaerovoracaceae bacterium]
MSKFENDVKNMMEKAVNKITSAEWDESTFQWVWGKVGALEAKVNNQRKDEILDMVKQFIMHMLLVSGQAYNDVFFEAVIAAEGLEQAK